MKIKHLVTSGCSFTDNGFGGRWPFYLGDSLSAQVYNRGQGSAGNEWISDSAIYQTNKLLSEKIPSDQILVVVCWSGIDRRNIFISKDERNDFYDLINHIDYPGCSNPISFFNKEPNKDQGTNEQGWLVGSPTCVFQNKNIMKLKEICYENFYSQMDNALTSLNAFLKLQWFCAAHGIKLYNFTYKEIFCYPDNLNTIDQNFPNLSYLVNMLKIDKWWFHENYGGLYDWCKSNKLSFYSDGLHPLPESHKKFVDDVLYNKILEVIHEE